MAVYSLTRKNYTVSGKTLTQVADTVEVLAFGGADAMSLNFTFDASWKSYEKLVYFRIGENQYTKTYPVLDGGVTVPGFVLDTARTFYFKLIGTKGLQQKETYWQAVVVAAPVVTGAYVDTKLLEQLDNMASGEANHVATYNPGPAMADTYASTAFIEIGEQVSGNGLHFESLTNGSSGNEYRLAVTQGVGALTVAVSGKTITVDLASGGSNANVVLNKILTQANTNSVINGWSVGASNGDGLVATMSATNFAGGDSNLYNYATTAQLNDVASNIGALVAALVAAGLMTGPGGPT